MQRGDQELNIISQYLWPRLKYTLQITPTELLKSPFLEELDFRVRI